MHARNHRGSQLTNWKTKLRGSILLWVSQNRESFGRDLFTVFKVGELGEFAR